METSAPKRRRTSPRSSIPVQPQVEVEAEVEAESTTPKGSPPRPAAARAKRPSFASPTKASLQRHNPDILRRRASPPKQPRSDQNAARPTSRPVSRGGSDASLSHALAAHFEGRAEAQSGSVRLKSREDFARRASQVGVEGVLLSPARRLGGKRDPAKPGPRPLPPLGPAEDEEILNPFARRGLRRSPPPAGGIPLEPRPEVEPAPEPESEPEPEPGPAPQPEPELPPTPEHPDPVVSTPPSGIHNTPSKRPRRNKALAERLKSSSPLKHPPARITPGSPEDPPLPFKVPAKPTKASKLGPSTTAPRPPTTAPSPSTAQIRGRPPEDPDAEKKKLRDALLAEIAALEHDLDVAAKENERTREAHPSKAGPSLPPNKTEVLDLLRRHALPPEEQAPEPEPQASWLHSALNPIAFLPFGKPSPKPPPLQAPSEDTEELPVSHHPLPMTSEEALPYLSVFTPLAFTAHISPLPPDDTSPGAPLLQRHTISATSASPRALFAARIDMTVNTRTMAVVDLAVPRLDPAAASELAPFIERVIAKEAQPSSALGNNVSVLAWAMGEWLRVAMQRARVWCVLERELAGSKEALEGMVERMRIWRQRRKKRRRRRGRVQRDDDDGDNDRDDNENDDGENADAVSGKFDAVELLPFMGRTSMDFEIPLLSGADGLSTLRVQWRIEFDWTGDARSEIGVLVGVPGKCEFFSSSR